MRYNKINNQQDSILLTISFWSSLIWVLLFSLAALLSATSFRNLDFSSSDLPFSCLHESRSCVRARWLSWSSCALLELYEVAHRNNYSSINELLVVLLKKFIYNKWLEIKTTYESLRAFWSSWTVTVSFEFSELKAKYWVNPMIIRMHPPTRIYVFVIPRAIELFDPPFNGIQQIRNA